MDLFLRLIATVIAAYSGQRGDSVWTGSTFRLRPNLLDRFPDRQIFPSRIGSFIDLSLINFFIRTRMSHVVRQQGWIPVLLSASQNRRGDLPDGPIRIHTRVVGWSGPYVEICHSWQDDTGAEFMSCDYITRVMTTKRQTVTGDDMLAALGEDPTPRPLSENGARLLADYLQLKDAA